MRRLTKTGLKAAAAMSAVGLMTTGCLGGGSKAKTTGDESPTAKTKISVMYAFSGAQSDAFQADLKAFASKNNLEIEFMQSDSFETMIQTKVQSGAAPDIAIFPQPGILQGLAAKGKLVPLESQLDLATYQKGIGDGFLEPGTYDGKVYGAPMSMNVKGLWWYNKDVWKAKGWTAPKTDAEFQTLLGTMKGTGVAPICYGMGSGSATGWPATDFIENYMLQANGPEAYSKWVKHEIKFDSPEVKKAFEQYDKLVNAEGMVYGGAKNAPSIQFGQALNPMFESSPKCYTGMQGNFITQKGFFPEAIVKSIDSKVGVYQTPAMQAGQNPIEVGGDLAAAFTANDTNVKKVMNFMLNDPTFGEASSKTGSWLSPLKSFDASKYPNQTLRDVVKIYTDAKVVRFDASDAMPAAVGSKAFWTEMVNYTSGKQDQATTLKNLDAAWPTD